MLEMWMLMQSLQAVFMAVKALGVGAGLTMGVRLALGGKWGW